MKPADEAMLERMSSRSLRIVVSVVAGLALSGSSIAATATADVSSIDAYAGQAQVFGKPHHRHRPSSHGAASTRAESHGGAAVQIQGNGGSTPPPSSQGTSSSAVAHRSSGGTSHSSRSTRSSGPSTAKETQPLDAAQPARASSGVGGLSTFDVLAIVLGALALLATALAVRRFTRPAA